MSFFQLGLILTIAAPFAFAVWIAFQDNPDGARLSFMGVVHSGPDIINSGLRQERFNAVTLDMEQEVRAAANSVADLARTHAVRVRLAVNPGTELRVDPFALRTGLREVIADAVRSAVGGEVMITAAALGPQMHIRVTDDRADTDQRSREAGAREAASLIALQGGSIAIQSNQGLGTTVTIRLPSRGRNDEARNDYVEETAMAEQSA
jgi:signal transduction histidine kinase